jgi:selenide,water dikinase
VVGEGAAAVELSLAMQHRLNLRVPRNRAKFSLVATASEILPHHRPAVRTRIERLLRVRRITVERSADVVRVGEREIELNNGRRLRADRVVWATGASAPAWPAGSGLRADERGFVLVNDNLQSLSHADVFAAGDVAAMVNLSQAKSGISAVRQGPALAHNLRSALRREPPRTHEPHSAGVQLITTGDRSAVVSWGALIGEGEWVWRWKDAIDRRFVARYQPHDRSR